MKRMIELDGLRGIAAVLVVFYHLPPYNPTLGIPLIRNSYLMVELFFVLSGFVICGVFGDTLKHTKDVLRFQVVRFGRLFPVHLLFLLIFVIFEIAKYILVPNFATSYPLARRADLSGFFQHLFLLQGVLPRGRFDLFNGPSWSISVEFYVYLLFGFIVLRLHRLRLFLFAALFLAALLNLIQGPLAGTMLLSRGICGFFLGCLTFEVIRAKKPRVPPLISDLFFISIPLFLALKTSGKLDYAVSFLTSGLIISLVCCERSAIKTALSWSVFQWLGTVSYSVYMCHTAIIWLFNQSLRFFLKAPEIVVEERSYPFLGPDHTVLAYSVYVLILLTTLVISHIVYTYVEHPWREKFKIFAARIS